MKRPLKTKLHFNRVNMQRKDSRVRTASNSHCCNQTERIVIKKGKAVVAKTVFKPDASQPRAYFTVFGKVTIEGNTVIVEV